MMVVSNVIAMVRRTRIFDEILITSLVPVVDENDGCACTNPPRRRRLPVCKWKSFWNAASDVARPSRSVRRLFLAMNLLSCDASSSAAIMERYEGEHQHN